MNSPWILGLAASHNGSACLLRGPQLVVAIQEERLIRQKRATTPAAFPSLAIDYCMNYAGITPSELAMVVICPAGSRRAPWNDIALNPQLRVVQRGIPYHYISHHLGHAIAAFVTSGFRDSAILIVDGKGSPWEDLTDSEKAVVPAEEYDFHTQKIGRSIRETISAYQAADIEIRVLDKHIAAHVGPWDVDRGMYRFNSLGDMYGAVGAQLFGSQHEGPGKLMGLAPYGVAMTPVENFYEIKNDRFYFKDTVCKQHDNTLRWPSAQDICHELAASTQRALEHAVLFLAKKLKSLSGNRCMCYAGGVALNSVANQLIVESQLFDDVFIMPAAEDSGTAIGAAYWGLWHLGIKHQRDRQITDSCGQVYKDKEILDAIEKTPAVLTASSSNIVDSAAQLLHSGKLLGWFQKGSELGPRALGHRTILCDPRNPNIKAILNERVKFREAFRPFAPVIPLNEVDRWFEQSSSTDSPFMLRVMRFRTDRKHLVPGVVHVDGTGRVQTVTSEQNPLLSKLLESFGSLSGIPLLLNTSFNIAGEPIIETPEDALWCLLFTNLDACMLENRLVLKSQMASVKDLTFRRLTNEIFFDALADLTPYHELAKPTIRSAHIAKQEDLRSVRIDERPELCDLAYSNTRWGQIANALPRTLSLILELMGPNAITGRTISGNLRSEGVVLSEESLRFALGDLRRAYLIEPVSII